ncbi:MAG TPA: SgcJ/EcaC family oxidoreductase, partial [Thermoanaerobaculia bacterium]|nr:SgcJ/EcaC family oxidoreductase [Thermoanaerobaculia bacterium]
MKRIALVLVLMLCATSLFAADAKTTIRAMADRFEAGVRNGDAAQMASIYADDAILMPPNAPAANGRAAIQEYWAGMLAMGKGDIKLTFDEVMVDGKTAIERGRWAFTLTPNGATEPIHD